MENAKRHFYEELMVGQKAALELLITPEMVAQFAELSGDYSPVHVDPLYAQGTEFERPIAHGMIAGMLFSRLIGMELPGAYSVYLSQQMTFHHPLYPGDRVRVEVAVEHKSDSTRTVSLATTIHHLEKGGLLVNGKALVRLLK